MESFSGRKERTGHWCWSENRPLDGAGVGQGRRGYHRPFDPKAAFVTGPIIKIDGGFKL